MIIITMEYKGHGIFGKSKVLIIKSTDAREILKPQSVHINEGLIN